VTGGGVLVIDAHTHVFPDAIAAAAVGSLAAEGGIRAHYDGTVAGLVSAMDRSGVTYSVVAPVATKASQVTGINDWVAGLPRERIVPLGAMHPDFADPAAEMDRLLALGVRGIKLHTQHQGFLPTDARMARIYEAASERGIVVLFHAGGYLGDGGPEGRPVDFARMLDAHPNMTCILAHMGGYRRWDEVRAHLCGRDVYFDTAYVPRNLADDAFVSLMRDHGIERILFGSDGPWTDAGEEIAYLSSIGLTADELRLVLGGNAARLFGVRTGAHGGAVG
jgi:hypothetical protein